MQPDTLHALLTVAVISLVTVMLRFLPFFFFRGKRPVPRVIGYLGQRLPYAIMGMLVVYCLKDLSFTAASGFVPALLAAGAVVLLHVWKRNTLLSIIGGTGCYMLLLHLIN